MADIFLSYKSDDRWIVDTLAGVFAIEGYAVWYDKALTQDDEYHKLIRKALEDAGVVVAVWSTRSTDSRWVYSEADLADKAGKLINASADGTRPPMPFERKNYVDLSGWSGDRSDPRVVTLLQSVRAVLERRSGETFAAHSAPPVDTVAARAWALIADSTTRHAYESFLLTHGASAQAALAKEHLRALKRWDRVDKDTPFAIRAFLQTGPYATLGTLAKRQVDAAKETYVRKNVARITSSIGQFAGPHSFLGWLALLLALPVIWFVGMTILFAPFTLAAAGARALFVAHPEIRNGVAGFVGRVQALDVFARFDIDTSGWDVSNISIWLVAIPSGLAVFLFVFFMIVKEAARTATAMDEQVRKYYQDKVAAL